MPWRLLRRNPIFVVIVVLLLSLGIGATTVMFSALDAFVLRPLPVRNPHELVRLEVVQPNLAPTATFTIRCSTQFVNGRLCSLT